MQRLWTTSLSLGMLLVATAIAPAAAAPASAASLSSTSTNSLTSSASTSSASTSPASTSDITVGDRPDAIIITRAPATLDPALVPQSRINLDRVAETLTITRPSSDVVLSNLDNRPEASNSIGFSL